MKKIFRLILVAVLVVTLSGCGKDENEIRVSWWGSNDRNNATLEAIDLYNESQDVYTIIPEYYDYDSYNQKFATQMAGNQAACVAQIDQPWLINYSSDDFVNLSDYAEELQVANYDQDLLDSITIEDKLLAIPASSNTLIYTFDKTVYDEAGVEVPHTWEEMLTVNAQLQDALGDDYYAIGSRTHDFLFMQYIYQMTGHLPLDEDGNWNYTDEDIAIGVDGVTAFLDSAVPPVEVQPDGLDPTDPNFVSGNIAGYYGWNAEYTNFVGQWPEGTEVEEVIGLPAEGQVTNGLFVKPSMAWAIPSSCENTEGALDVLEFLTTNEDAILAQGTQRGVPANSNAATILADNGQLEGQMYDTSKKLAKEEKVPFPVLDAEVTTEIYDNFENYRYGDVTKEEIVTNISEKAKEIYS